ncbi:sensor histidine kinase [Paraflavitalea pollutisoli]|uniref:sensor histidine kinase n=1 Tax=Paraflavitalea pollutisoli TaxID=3034143 RepID=UPI0023EB9B95|nr:HAMP domain-containing sensor histidine kinase [Paraflavitalea sp. H1-2-19X]
MSKLLNLSLKKMIVFAVTVLVCSIPVYYVIFTKLWQMELDEHHIILTDEAGREDSYLIIVILTGLTVLFLVLLLVGFILLNRSISKRLWKPFYHSLEKIRHFDLNQREKPSFEATEIDEFKALNQSLDKLIGSSIAAYNQQKEFADNASHELQTPLAIVQSKLELLMQNQSLTTEQYAIIEETLKALSRVTRINKNLLLLTKIENSQYMDRATIDLSALLEETIHTFTPFAQSKDLELSSAIPPGITLEGNRILVEIVLNNLITNAIRYCTPQGGITVNLSPGKLVIANSGLEKLRQEQLFKRFGTTSSTKPGTGLGLALVKQISQRYGWEVRYRFENNCHYFTLAFQS